MRYSHSLHGAIYANGRVYVLGGNDEYGVSSSMFENFSIQTGQWSELPQLPKPLTHTSVSLFGNVIMFTDLGARSVFSYNVITEEFSRIRCYVPEKAIKIVCATSETSAVVLKDNHAVEVTTNGEGRKLIVKHALREELNTNCPVLLDNENIHFISGFKTFKYSFENGSIESTS